MPKRTTSTKSKTKNKGSFSAARLIKTNGKFSKGKLAIIIVAFVAIAALVYSTTFAADATFDDAYMTHIGPGYPGTVSGEAGWWLTVNNQSTLQSAIFSSYVANPSGSKGAICVGASSGSGSAGTTLSATVVRMINGQPDWNSLGRVGGSFFINNIAGARQYCTAQAFVLPPGYTQWRVEVTLSQAPRPAWVTWVKVAWF